MDIGHSYRFVQRMSTLMFRYWALTYSWHIQWMSSFSLGMWMFNVQCWNKIVTNGLLGMDSNPRPYVGKSLPLAIRICIVYVRRLNHVPNFIELLKHKQKVAKHNRNMLIKKRSSQTTMSRVQFVTGILLISFEQKYKQCSAKEAPCNLGPVDGPTILTVIMLLLKGTEHVW